MKTYRRKCLRNVVKPVQRKEVPAIFIGAGTITSGVQTMIVTLRLREPGAHEQFRRFCNRKFNNCGWEILDGERGIYVVSGLPEVLEKLSLRWWVREWQWDTSTRVVGGSGVGDKGVMATVAKKKQAAKKEKRDRFTDQAQLNEEKQIDAANSKKLSAREKAFEASLFDNEDDKVIANPETLVKANTQAAARQDAEDKVFYGKMGLTPP